MHSLSKYTPLILCMCKHRRLTHTHCTLESFVQFLPEVTTDKNYTCFNLSLVNLLHKSIVVAISSSLLLSLFIILFNSFGKGPNQFCHLVDQQISAKIQGACPRWAYRHCWKNRALRIQYTLNPNKLEKWGGKNYNCGYH